MSCVRPGQGSFSPRAKREQSWVSWPHLAKQSRVFHTMCRHASFWLGELGGGNSVTARERAEAVDGESCSLSSAVLFCVFSLSVSLLLLFHLFAVLLNCPYPDPPVSACFFPFSSALQQGEGRPRALLLPAAAKL